MPAGNGHVERLLDIAGIAGMMVLATAFVDVLRTYLLTVQSAIAYEQNRLKQLRELAAHLTSRNETERTGRRLAEASARPLPVDTSWQSSISSSRLCASPELGVVRAVARRRPIPRRRVVPAGLRVALKAGAD
jgi:hypothetical protein